MTIFVKRKPYAGFIELFCGGIIEPLIILLREGEREDDKRESLVINCEILIDMISSCIVNVTEVRNRVFEKAWFFHAMFRFPQKEPGICEYD